MSPDNGSGGAPPPGGPPDDEARRRFEALALPHLPRLYRLAVRLADRSQDAEDLVQDAFLRALRGFPSLREAERIRSWLTQILTRVVIDRQRGTRPEVPVGDLEALDRFSLYDLISDEDPFPYSDTLHCDFLAQFEDEEVLSALRALPETYRVPLVLVYVEELSYRELAELLGWPIGTVMSRLHRARKILERELWECAKRRGFIRSDTP